MATPIEPPAAPPAGPEAGNPQEPPAPPAGDPTPPAPTGEGDPDAPLGAAGEKALGEWKKRAKDAERLSKEQATKLKEFEDAQKSEAERLAERVTTAEERATKATRLAVASKVEALAAVDFADPADAVDALNPADYVDDSGAIDSDAIKTALADLLERKPHWGKAAAGPRTPKPDRGQGGRPEGTTGDVEDQIKDAQAKGDWRTVMRLQNSKLAAPARTK
ncbi:hypothetical protein OG530_19265 [Streptomyces decoyicus]|uniref:hypothetical protein n=1 Tax=Streptomyces decoyicus TaxID=249567 RepID=UPI002E1882DA